MVECFGALNITLIYLLIPYSTKYHVNFQNAYASSKEPSFKNSHKQKSHGFNFRKRGGQAFVKFLETIWSSLKWVRSVFFNCRNFNFYTTLGWANIALLRTEMARAGKFWRVKISSWSYFPHQSWYHYPFQSIIEGNDIMT